MGVRRRLGRWLRRLGERFDPDLPALPPATSAKLPEAGQLDRAPAAGSDETPSEPWQGVRERALGKTLTTLRSEAIVALGALHAAHTAAAAVFDDRRLAAAVAQRSGEPVADEVLDKFTQAATIWHRDAAALGMALNAVGAVEVPELTLAEALEVDEPEAEALEAMVSGYEVELQRQVLEESEQTG
ncbi:MAG: hypothetical protein RLZZ468_1934 [Cyanobacteriota bacterium]